MSFQYSLKRNDLSVDDTQRLSFEDARDGTAGECGTNLNSKGGKFLALGVAEC
ncbi:hypothetical protein G7Y31_01875 [Corynebacterium lizhenjunii]|uniref:Uncharacterized protein n=1 Tax=Corynebacterium lizhenjunii TaxID=2709394 RepID=A0A7T0KFB7_9CORY|nr:hypothetical protein [Corynebacterium lizhenjunii]QPK79484.1 hypothetical protein G7Y31_01875 [Corynebacterium lizhenjunii]